MHSFGRAPTDLQGDLCPGGRKSILVAYSSPWKGADDKRRITITQNQRRERHVGNYYRPMDNPNRTHIYSPGVRECHRGVRDMRDHLFVDWFWQDMDLHERNKGQYQDS